MDKEAERNLRPAGSSLKERVAIALEVEVSGCAIDGRDFVDRARTRIINRNGAAIVINRRLAPQQTLTIRRVGSEQEAEGRVVGYLGRDATGGDIYGIALIDAAMNFWGIDFPAEETDDTLIKLLLECPGCHTRQMVALGQSGLDAFAAQGHVSRRCFNCRDVTLWRQSASGVPPEPPPTDSLHTQPVASSQTKSASPATKQPNRRRYPRVKMGLKGRILLFGQETPIEVTDVSRGGAQFICRRSFADGTLVRVAVPYTPGAANLYVAAKICWCRGLPSGISECGLQYERYATPPRK